jgi:hypothetical protein
VDRLRMTTSWGEYLEWGLCPSGKQLQAGLDGGRLTLDIDQIGRTLVMALSTCQS